MALFRRLAGLQQLNVFSIPGRGLLFLTPVGRVTVRDSKRTLRRYVSIGFLQQKLASNVFLTGSVSVLCTPCRCLYTQTGGSLAASAKEKQTTSGSTSSKSQKHEHGSVLQELMKVKEKDQPKQLTVGAKGVQQAQAEALGLTQYHSLSSLPFQSSFPSSFLNHTVVQAGRDFTYLLVVLGGFAVAGFLLWSVGSEFISYNSPQTLYAKALKRVRQDPQVTPLHLYAGLS